MRLGDWLEKHDVTYADFGARIGSDAPSVSRYVRGLHVPRPATMAAIVRETAGAVTANDFMPEDGSSEPRPTEGAAA